MKTVIFFIITILVFSAVSSSAFASEKTLGVDPALTRIELRPSQEITSSITISNLSDEPISFDIAIIPFTASSRENGEVTYYSERTSKNNHIFEFLETVKVMSDGNEIDSLTLAPHQQKKLEIKVQAGEKMIPSDYYFSILFISDAGLGDKIADTNTYSQISSGVASHILLTIGPQKKAQAFIEEFSSPLFLIDKKAQFHLRVKNTGKHLVQPKGIVYIKNMFGQTVGKIDLSSVYILSDTIRAIPDKSSYASNETQESSQRIHWNEALLLGPYSATVVVQMEPNAYTFSQTVYFIGIPVQLLLIASGSLLGIGFLVFRVKKIVRLGK